VNSQSVPGRILLRHPLDESLKLGIDLWPAEADVLTVPADTVALCKWWC
jgi:hypothetical protein